MEANGPLPIGPDAATQDNVARVRADIERVSNETRDPLGWAAVAYYLTAVRCRSMSRSCIMAKPA
jgi:hypothetical protein